MTSTRDFVEYAVWAQKKFYDLYYDESLGLISISSTGIQVTEQGFKRIVDTYPVAYDVHPFIGRLFEASTKIQGVEICTIGTEEELKSVGLEW